MVNYFSEGNKEMYASIGDLSKDGEAVFENGKYHIAEYQVIPIEKALECALLFWDSQEKPNNIQWEEL